MPTKAQIRIVAKAFALAAYRRANAEASSDQAHAFAERSWRGFVDRAIDFLAVRAALGEEAFIAKSLTG